MSIESQMRAADRAYATHLRNVESSVVEWATASDGNAERACYALSGNGWEVVSVAWTGNTWMAVGRRNKP